MTTPPLKESIYGYNRKNTPHKLAPSAALIDMDGTLYNSMPNHAKAWHRTISELGISCTLEEFFLYEGRTGSDTINLIWNRAFGKDADPEEAARIYDKKAAYFAQMGIPGTITGAQSAVAALIDRNITTVLVTGSGQPSTLQRLDTDFPNAFPTHRRITSASVTHGKPHPEPFQKAMQLANVKPWQCIAIDNAPLGVESAAKAGAFTIGIVTGPIQVSDLYNAGADIVFTSMQELTEKLTELLDHQL